MWGQRIIRLLIMALVASGVVLLGSKVIKNKSAVNSIKLPEVKIGRLPQENLIKSIEEKILGAKNEPISQPTEDIQQQTQSLIEAIKNLPADQVEAVKKQLFKELCQDYCQSENKQE